MKTTKLIKYDDDLRECERRRRRRKKLIILVNAAFLLTSRSIERIHISQDSPCVFFNNNKNNHEKKTNIQAYQIILM